MREKANARQMPGSGKLGVDRLAADSADDFMKIWNKIMARTVQPGREIELFCK